MPVALVSQESQASVRIAERSVAVSIPHAPRAREGQDAATGGKFMPPEAAPDKQPPQMQGLTEAVEGLNEYVQTVRRDLQFSIDEQSGRTVIKVIDAETKQMIRQIPAEEILALARNLDRSGEGTILQAHV